MGDGGELERTLNDAIGTGSTELRDTLKQTIISSYALYHPWVSIERPPTSTLNAHGSLFNNALALSQE